MPKKPKRCRWVRLTDAISEFTDPRHSTQSSKHIKPLHWHVACRLVVEGGFSPDDVTPRPPFVVNSKGGGSNRRYFLEYAPESAGSGERSILGGLKTKQVDVVVTKDGIGPCVAVSMKGTLNAFRNLTNRMEEAVGDCTNLHISYPSLVYAFLHVIKATKAASGVPANDIAIDENGIVVDSLLRYHDAMARLAGREDVRDDTSRYEAIALAFAEVLSANGRESRLMSEYPPLDSPLGFQDFFDKIYEQYDKRFVYAAPALASATRRMEWDPASPVLNELDLAGIHARLSA